MRAIFTLHELFYAHYHSTQLRGFMKGNATNINIGFENGKFDYSGAFNAFSIRHIGNVILFAFIFKDINGTILASSSYSMFASSLEQNRDSFWRYLNSRKEEFRDFNEPTFVFSNLRNVEIIHANTNQESSEITLGAFSLLHLTRFMNLNQKKNQSAKNQSALEYNDAFIVAIFKSDPIVHKSFVKKLLDELEIIRDEAKKQ